MLQILADRITKARNKNLPFVIYNKPNVFKVKMIFQEDNQLHYQNNFETSGFVFAPFDDTNRAIIFPTAVCSQESITLEKKPLEYKSVNNTKLVCSDAIAKQNHIDLVKKGLFFLKENQASKVVLSRSEEIKMEEVDVSKVFINLLQKYPSAFVYLWFHPKIGLWMGASPETLLRVKKNTFKTMSLAGTQQFKGTLNVNWGDKEKEEQQFVTDYILNKIGSNLIKVTVPFTLKAGGLLHICTEISGKITTPNSLENLVKILHPTPAICGIPKDATKSFILKNENYNRSYYTGYLGELNINDETNLFVNLRCMQINNTNALIYVGGGITVGSLPENEWNETVVKSEVMKLVLR